MIKAKQRAAGTASGIIPFLVADAAPCAGISAQLLLRTTFAKYGR